MRYNGRWRHRLRLRCYWRLRWNQQAGVEWRKRNDPEWHSVRRLNRSAVRCQKLALIRIEHVPAGLKLGRAAQTLFGKAHGLHDLQAHPGNQKYLGVVQLQF